MKQLRLDGAVARTSDPETSQAAARSINADWIRTSQRKILYLLERFGPMHDHLIYQRLLESGIKMSESGARTRRGELVGRGLVEQTKYRAVLPSGRKAIVWKAVPGKRLKGEERHA